MESAGKKHLPLTGTIFCVISLCRFFTLHTIHCKKLNILNIIKSLSSGAIRSMVKTYWILLPVATSCRFMPLHPWPTWGPGASDQLVEGHLPNRSPNRPKPPRPLLQDDPRSGNYSFSVRPNMSQFREPWWVSLETGFERWKVDDFFSEGLLMHAGYYSRARLGGATDS